MALPCGFGSQSLKKVTLFAGGAIVASVASLFLVVLVFVGRASFALPTAMEVASESGVAENHLLLRLLVALITTMVVARVLGSLLQSFQQPPVIGEILGGIAI